MANKTKFLTREDGYFKFDFHCEGCNAEGDLSIPDTEKIHRFNCPDGCGSSYVMYDNPPKMMCVVQRMLVKEH